jgi:Ser/Thr protein kinase RdoA (MazF antagonist)
VEEHGMSDNNPEFPLREFAQVADFVSEHYEAQPIALAPIGHDATPSRAVFRCDFADGSTWSLHVFAQHAVTPVWFGGGLARDWLRGRAALLAWLERQSYPAPRVIPTHAGASMAENDGTCMLALSYIPGDPSAMSRDEPRQLGALLGRLHMLAVPSVQIFAVPEPIESQSLPNSWWYPAGLAVAPLLDGLEAIANDVPARWQALHARFGEDFRTVAKADLPVTLIHGDCHPGNAIVTPDGSVAFIDWECAGIGTPVLDLGGLLADCSPDPVPGEAIVVDPAKVAAVMEGHQTYRTLTSTERDILLTACRFGVAFQGAIRFLWALENGWSERIERSLVRLQARYDAAEQAAVLALATL